MYQTRGADVTNNDRFYFITEHKRSTKKFLAITNRKLSCDIKFPWLCFQMFYPFYLKLDDKYHQHVLSRLHEITWIALTCLITRHADTRYRLLCSHERQFENRYVIYNAISYSSTGRLLSTETSFRRLHKFLKGYLSLVDAMLPVITSPGSLSEALANGNCDNKSWSDSRVVTEQ